MRSVGPASTSHLAPCPMRCVRLNRSYQLVGCPDHASSLGASIASRQDNGDAAPAMAPTGSRRRAFVANPPEVAHRRGCRRRRLAPHAASAECPGVSTPDGGNAPSSSYDASKVKSGYTLEDTRSLVETAMLAAVSGLAYLLSTILKLENSLGYFLPLPVVLAALRGSRGAGWRTMAATCFLLVVLLGPLRALSYFFLHGLLAASLGSLWRLGTNFWLSILLGAVVRMAGQLSYLVMSSVTMNENMFALLLSNVYNMLDQVTAAMGISGAPSPLAVSCMVFSLLLVNGLIYCFLVHVVYRVLLGSMGYKLGPLPELVNKYLYAGAAAKR